MARQLAQRNVAKLKLASAGHSFDWLQWNLSDRKAVALPILRRRGGLLVAEAITAEEAEAGIVGEEITDLGPTQRTEVSATMAGDEAEEPPFLVEVLLLDVPTAKFSTFSIVAGPAGILEDCFHFGADAQLIPDAGELTAAAREWVQQGGSHSEAYLTAIEADRPARAAADPMALVLDQLGSLSRSEEHTSELQSRFGVSYAVFCLKKNLLKVILKNGEMLCMKCANETKLRISVVVMTQFIVL